MEWRYKGFPCLIVRNPMGALCGYVGVPPGHPLNGVGYNDCVFGCADFNSDDFHYCEHRPEGFLRVHGGLTFADACRDDGPICHVTMPGEPESVWWLGFDCSHCDDLTPRLISLMGGKSFGEIYRDIPYVQNEVESLADQLSKLKGIQWTKFRLRWKSKILAAKLKSLVRA